MQDAVEIMKKAWQDYKASGKDKKNNLRENTKLQIGMISEDGEILKKQP